LPSFSLAYQRCDLQESKSVGAEVNWGVRFKDVKDVGILMHFEANYHISVFNKFE